MSNFEKNGDFSPRTERFAPVPGVRMQAELSSGANQFQVQVSHPLLWAFSRDLFLNGVKCGNVSYPAVPNGEAILRFAVNAKHTQRDLQKCVEIMTRLGKKYGILRKSKEEIRAVGKHIRFEEGALQ